MRITTLAFVVASLLIVGQATAAYEVKVNLNTLGGGTGRVIFSATSSSDFEFFGWSGESCIGKDTCLLKDLIPKSSKIVIASFNAPICAKFIYSEFGICQLDGTRRRTVISAGPPGCVGGESITSQRCFYDPCARAQTYEKENPSLIDRFRDWFSDKVEKIKNITDSVKNGELAKAIDKTVELVSGNKEYAPYVPPEGTGGGVPVEGGNFDVIGKGGQKVGAGGAVVNIPAPGGGTISIPAPVSTPAPESGPVREKDLGKIDLGYELDPITVTVPRDKSPDFDFEWPDNNWGRNPCN